MNDFRGVVRPDADMIRQGLEDGTFSGKVIAISTEDGTVVETADSIDELAQLMLFRFPNCEYRTFCCPGSTGA